MDIVIETALEIAGELISEGIDVAITAKKEKKRKQSQEEKADVSEELNH